MTKEDKAYNDLLNRVEQLEAQVGLPAKDPRAPTVAMRLDAIEMQDFERADALLARHIGALQERIDTLERNAAMQRLTDIQREMERSIESLTTPLPKELKLQEQVNRDLPVGCKRCTHPLWCGIKCDACGKVWDWGDKEWRMLAELTELRRKA